MMELAYYRSLNYVFGQTIYIVLSPSYTSPQRLVGAMVLCRLPAYFIFVSIDRAVDADNCYMFLESTCTILDISRVPKCFVFVLTSVKCTHPWQCACSDPLQNC